MMERKTWAQETYERGVAKGLEEGMEKGREEGREQGREEGREQGFVLGMFSLLMNRIKETGEALEDAFNKMFIPQEYRPALRERFAGIAL